MDQKFWEYYQDIITGRTSDKALELYSQCRYDEAREYFQKTMKMFSYARGQLSFPLLDGALDYVEARVKAVCLVGLGDVERALGNMEPARGHYELAMRLAEANDDRLPWINSLLGLGTYFINMGNYESALECCHKGLDLLDGQKDNWHARHKLLSNLGVIYQEIGLYDKALEYSQKAVETSYSGEYRKFLATSLNNLACLHMDIEDFEQAIKTLDEALAVCDKKIFWVRNKRP